MGSCARLCAGVLAGCTLAGIAACTLGPDYQRPPVEVPDHFEEGVQWQRAHPATGEALRDDWWRSYHDEVLDGLVERALQANLSIAQAEAAYRVAEAGVRSAAAAYFPTISAGLGASRSGFGSNAPVVVGNFPGTRAYDLYSTSVGASWLPDLWGSVRRNVESARAGAQASDAQRAGIRLSICASVAADYFALRQADVDLALLTQQRALIARLRDMAVGARAYGGASDDEVLAANNALDAVSAAVQAVQALREQDEHALAVLLGQVPAAFTLAAQADYTFTVPPIPLGLPSQLLERRYDVVMAERTAAAANAKIGVAKAAFFPTLTLSAQGALDSQTLPRLLSYSNRVWTLGSSLAEKLFDAGARNAALDAARADYDAQAALYRNTVIAAFQGVEDALSALHHLDEQVASQARILGANQTLYEHALAQWHAGATSEQSALDAQLLLLQARQSETDTRAAWSRSSIALILNLGGGWQWQSTGTTAPLATSAALAGSRP